MKPYERESKELGAAIKSPVADFVSGLLAGDDRPRPWALLAYEPEAGGGLGAWMTTGSLCRPQ